MMPGGRKRMHRSAARTVSGGAPELVGELLAKLPDFGRDNEGTVRLLRVVAKVILVIVFSEIERRGGAKLGHDGIVPYLGSIQLANDLLGGRALLVTVVKNDGAVLCAHVVALPVSRGWIVNREENFQDIPVRRDARIKGHPHHFYVSGNAAAHVAICRIRRFAAHISGLDREDTLHLNEDGLQAPETAAA